MRPAAWRLLVAVLALLLLALPAAKTALAHANLVRSDPGPNAVLVDAPVRVRLAFSEPPDPSFSEIQVLDTSGQRRDRGGLEPDPADPLALSVPLDSLPPGVYTVSWKAFSSVDGHTTRGSFAFAVGQEQAAALQRLQAPVATAPAAEGDSGATPAWVSARWAGYLAGALLVGSLALPPLVLLRLPTAGRRTGRGARAPPLPDANVWQGLVLLLATLALAAAALASLYGALVQAASAADVGLPQALGRPLRDLLLGTRYGWVFWGRLALLAALWFLLGAMWRRGVDRHGRIEPRWWWAALLLGGLVLFTTSLNSHAAARPPVALSIAADWLHLVAASVWLGGLVALSILLLRQRAPRTAVGVLEIGAEPPPHLQPATLSAIVNRFSQVATVCVVVLAASGLFRAVVEVADLANLTDTPYGMALLVKLALLVPLLVLAALNLFLLRRRVALTASAPPTDPTARTWLARLRASMGGEVVLVSGVLLATGFMTSMAPARDYYGNGLVVRGQADDVRTVLVVSPGEAGLNTFTLFLRDDSGAAIGDAQKVALLLVHADMEMGVSEVVAAPLGNGRYQVQGGQVSMSGVWRGEALVRRSGRDDVRIPLEFRAADPPGSATAPTAQPAGLPVQAIIGLELVAAGAVLALAARRLARARVWAGRLALAGGIAVAAYGAYIAVQGFYTEVTPTAALQNPVPADARSLARGQQIYARDCAVCHGESGRGDGPAGMALRPPPSDLRVHMAAGHTDGQLFWWITNGFPGTAMPAWKDKLDERERWDAINYIKTFAQPSVAAPVAATGLPTTPNPANQAAGASPPARTAGTRGATPLAAPTAAVPAQAPSPSGALGSAPVAPIATPLAVPPVALTALAQPPPAEATPPATAAVEPAAAGTVAAEQVPTPDAAGRIALSRSSGDLVVNVTLVPQALGTSEYDVSLEDAAGRPFTAARRVAVKLAMQGMSHGLFSREGTAAGPGRYLASGNDLVMSGPWHGWVVVDLPDGSVRVVDFAFQTGPPLPAVVQERIRSDSPPGVQLVNVAAYPDELLALPLSLMPGTPARVEAVLADGATCGGRLRVPSLGLEAPFSAGGFARLDFPVDRLMVLTARCGEQGLDLLEEP